VLQLGQEYLKVIIIITEIVFIVIAQLYILRSMQVMNHVIWNYQTPSCNCLFQMVNIYNTMILLWSCFS